MSIEVMTPASMSYPAAPLRSALHQDASRHLRHLIVIIEV